MTTPHFGPLPAPRSGRRTIDYADPAAAARAVAAELALKQVWVEHPPQEAIVARICNLLESNRGIRGQPLPGLRLSEDNQAGKSGTLQRCAAVLAERRTSLGLSHNPYELVVVGLDKKISLKGVYQDILIQLHDENWADGTEKVLRQRVDEFCQKLEVAAIAIDEVQHLKREAGEVTDVTDALKRLLDLGIVPLILVGDLHSKPFFERNGALAARLGVPLELTPLDYRRSREAVYFKTFCVKYDEALVRTGATKIFARLSEPAMLKGLHAASGGHVGRVARILQEAVKHAAWRDAVTIDDLDLSHVVRTFAIPNWIKHDPFEA
jgi:hypothetical protein